MATALTSDITTETFDKEVLEEKDKVVMVDFWGLSCQPCLALMPTVEKLAETYTTKLKIVKVETPPQRKLAIRLRVMSLPTFLFYKDGEELKRISKEVSPEELRQAVKSAVEA